MRYNTVKKTKTPAKAKPFTDKGYTCYTELEISSDQQEKQWHLDALTYQINVLYNLITCTCDRTYKFLNHVNSDVSYLADEIDDLWKTMNDDQKELVESRYSSFGYSSKLFEQATNGYIDDTEVNQEIDNLYERTMDDLKLSSVEVDSFVEKIKKTRNFVKGAAINIRCLYMSNLFHLLKEYGDEVIITPTRQPVSRTLSSYNVSLGNEIEDELNYTGKLENYSIFDRFRIFFKTRDIANEFMNKLTMNPLSDGVFDVYDARNIRHYLYVCNTMVDSINENKSNKSYNVFISQRERAMKDGAVGYITIQSGIYTLGRTSTNGHINYSEDENIRLVSEIYDDVMERINSINKKSEKWGLPKVILESNVMSSFHYGNMSPETIVTNSGLYYILKKSRKFNGCAVTTSKFTSYEELEKQLTIASTHPIFSSVFVQLHIPIYNDVSPENYSRILNYIRLINMDVNSLMLLPFCMGSENKDALIKIIDELFEK